MTLTTFIEFHALRSFPPSNLNRDDLGSPKTAIFGGSRRLRISSQCLKRTWRMSQHFRGAFAEEQLGIRTERLPEQVLAQLGDEVNDAVKDGLLALLSSIGRKKAVGASEGDEDGEPAEDGNDDATLKRTAHLLYLSMQEINAVTAFAKENSEKLIKALKKKKPDGEAIKNLRKDLEAHLEQHTSKNAVDIGLFGRFITSEEFDTIEGALQVAHGLGTQKVELEYDYFTAVDDLSDEPGAGHLGETEFASSVLYLYACCDLEQLARNLGARGKVGRISDTEALQLAKQSLPALARAMAEATPKGKKTGTAPHTPAEYVEVVIRRGAPLSFANAFTKPVAASECDGDVMAASIQRFAAHRDRIESAYGRDADVTGRFVLCLRDVEGSTPEGASVASISELASKLSLQLDALVQA